MVRNKGNKKQTVNLLSCYNTEKLYLVIGGFYPVKSKYQCLYLLSASFNLIIAWLQFLSLIIFLYCNLSNVTKVSEILLFCMTQFAFLNKLTNFILQKRGLLILENMLQNPLFTNVTLDEASILRDYIKNGRLIAKIYRALCFLVVLFYGLFPFMDSHSGTAHTFPLPAWFPFDPNNYYYEVFFMEILSIASGAWINSNIDILTIVMIILATAQFEILKKKLMNVIETKTMSEYAISDLLMEIRIKECIRHYNELLCFVSQIENIFSNGIFVQFFCSVIVICLTGFQMLVISINSMQFILLVVYFSCMMCQIAMYCWYGHIIMESSNQITEACYNIEWNNCNLKIQKMLVIIMERAKRPARIRAGNFFILNIQTLMTILRSSYSYFAVLQRLYSKK